MSISVATSLGWEWDQSNNALPKNNNSNNNNNNSNTNSNINSNINSNNNSNST